MLKPLLPEFSDLLQESTLFRKLFMQAVIDEPNFEFALQRLAIQCCYHQTNIVCESFPVYIHSKS